MSDPKQDSILGVLRHWREAEEPPRCQHCDCIADERSFMCENCAYQADTEVQTLRDQLAGAVGALEAVERVLLQIDVDLTAQGHPPTSPDRERVRKGLAVIYHQRGQ